MDPKGLIVILFIFMTLMSIGSICMYRYLRRKEKEGAEVSPFYRVDIPAIIFFNISAILLLLYLLGWLDNAF